MSNKNFFLVAAVLFVILMTAFIITAFTGEVSRRFLADASLATLLGFSIGIAIAYPINRFMRNHSIKFERKDELE